MLCKQVDRDAQNLLASILSSHPRSRMNVLFV
jgi:hypothetical protein